MVMFLLADFALITPKPRQDNMENAKVFYLKSKAQGMVEYALILVLVAVVVIAALTIMGSAIGDIFSTINGAL